MTSLPEKVELRKGKNRLVIGFAYDRNNCPDYRNRGKIKRAGIHFTKTETPRTTGFPLAVPAFANGDYFRFVNVATRGRVFW